MPTPSRRLGTAFEQLEDRALPSSFGVPWADPGHMTLSFTADGTTTPAGPSGLFADLAPTGTAAAWQREILRAFQTWAVSANINIGLVSDGGQALSAVGAVQGDARFGDVRIAGAPLGADQVAFASPFSWSGTTFAGDVLFNTAQQFTTVGRAGGFDLFSVALHEAGHVFGLDHDADDTVMSAGYLFASALSADDVAALRSLYGARTADAFDLKSPNGTLSTASALIKDAAVAGRYTAEADLTTTSDVDVYNFKAETTAATVTLWAKGLSLLQARVSVFDAAGRLVASGAAANVLDNDVALQLTGLTPGSTYSIKVESATSDVFGVGGYRVTADVGGGKAPKPLAGPSMTDGHTNDELSKATDLTKAKAFVDDQFDVVFRGAIEDATDTDVYKIHAPKTADGGAVNLNVMVWAADGSLNPRVQVFDATGKAVAFQVLANTTGLMSVVVQNARADANYFIQVSASTSAGTAAVGGYFLGADFNQSAQALPQEVGTNALGTAAPSDTSSYTTTAGGLFEFVLSADALSVGAGGVTLTVTDAAGKVVFVLDSVSGQPAVTAAQYLAAGAYTFRYAYHTVSGQPAAPVRYHLSMLKLSEGVGTYPPTTTTTTTTTAPTTTTTTTTTTMYIAPTIKPATTLGSIYTF